MLHIHHPPSMPSTLLSGYHLDHTNERHHLPQLREFNWDWDKLRSKTTSSSTAEQKLPRPSGYNSHLAGASTSSKVDNHPAPDFIAPLTEQYMNPPSGPPTTLATLYPTPHTHSRQNSTSNGRPFYQSYYSARQNQSPPAKKATVGGGEVIKRRTPNDSNNIIAPELQIPSSINDSRGSLPEFAAQITCLFWFESAQTLQLAQQILPRNLTPTALNPDAMPSTGFRKWVTTILSMTQVTPNVIILALMFIYRLKSMNPGVKGKVGSEFRLLTVALMLGNKFLDDNTYTNKTWAEVSGISVQEIHVMEVEFLSNMRYSLFVNEKQWDEWHKRLGRFSIYYDRAAEEATRVPNSVFSRTPVLPSPPNSVHTSPPLARTSPSHAQSVIQSLFNSTNPSPVSLPPPENDPTKAWGRKRSIEETHPDYPAKRSMPYAPPPSLPPPQQLDPTTNNAFRESNSPVPRLPLPNIPSTSQHGGQGYTASHLPMPEASNASQYGGQGLSSTHHLPMPVTRAMASVFPAPTRWAHSGVQLPSLPASSQHFNTPGSMSDSPGTGFGRSSTTYGPSSRASSPTSFAYSHPNSSTPTSLSPSGMPLARSSPYKPVRGVHTLLVPPPSAAVFHAPQQLSYDQMRYQPLGQPKTETRTGVLPHLPFDTWSAAHQLQHYLPVPNFGP